MTALPPAPRLDEVELYWDMLRDEGRLIWGDKRTVEKCSHLREIFISSRIQILSEAYAGQRHHITGMPAAWYPDHDRKTGRTFEADPVSR